MLQVFVGIDVACAKKKRLPVCFVENTGNRPVPLQLNRTMLDFFPRGEGNTEVLKERPFDVKAERVALTLREIGKLKGWKIARVAIDAPAEPPESGERAPERAMAEQGISYFQTPARSKWNAIVGSSRAHLNAGGALQRLPNANRIWMLYGFALFKALSKEFEVLEAYPHATVHSVVGPCPHKSTEEGYSMQLAGIAKATGWLPPNLERALGIEHRNHRSKHDMLDAYMAAWVASLPTSDRQCFGDKNCLRNSIWIPRRWAAQPPSTEK